MGERMTPPPSLLPLAAAAERLRGKPGRPRKASPAPACGHTPGTLASRDRVNDGPASSALASQATAPRLLDVAGAAAYLSVSSWTIRDLLAAGRLPRVRLPLAGDRECRRVLLDRADLDRLIDASKEAP